VALTLKFSFRAMSPMPETNRLLFTSSNQEFLQWRAAMKLNKQSGQALVFSALGATVLIGFAGLAIDMGMLRYQKRLQTDRS